MTEMTFEADPLSTSEGHGHSDLGTMVLSTAARLRGAPALRVGEETLTYAQLVAAALSLAGRLHDALDAHPSRVGIIADRSTASYVSTLATLLAGAAFVPLNPRYPVVRTAAMAEQAGLDAILVTPGARGWIKAATAPLETKPVLVDAETDGAEQPPTEIPDVRRTDIAYILFTSGSTGRPKGVPITHGNVLAFLATNLERYALGPDDRLSQTFEQTFDLSVFDLFMAWGSGASVHVVPPLDLLAPARFVTEHDLTLWFSVPSVAAMLLKRGTLAPGSLPSLRWSLFCGEALPRSVAKAWQAAAPRSMVENLYGPTELTIACTAYRWDPSTSEEACERDIVPIGRPYLGLDAVLLDGDTRAAPGEPGELCVAGAQTASGYWRNPEHTRDRFVVLTSDDGVERTYYRTGDIVVPRGDDLLYLGRSDHQVQIGGHRVELGEVEAVLREAGCVDAVALPWPCGDAPRSIVAVVSGAERPERLAVATRERLPPYMVPHAIHVIDDLPVNANGKVDRAALSAHLERLAR